MWTADGDGPTADNGAAGPAGEPLLGVAAAARILGIAPATLRTWDRRYGLGPSGHTPGRHRRYSREDLARLDVMRRALLRGASAADAAEHARTTRATPDAVPEPVKIVPAPVEGAGAAWPDGQGGPVGRVASPAPDAQAPRRPGGGVLRLGTAGPAARGLGRAAVALDAHAVRELLADAIAARGVVAAWDDVVRPVLVAVARRWAYSGAGVEIEHLLSGCLTAALNAHTVGLPVTDRPVVLLAGMPGELHTLPTLALAAALAEHGIGCRSLGADLPASALVSAIRRTAPAAVFLWSQQAETADVELVRSLPRTRPRFRTYLGGPGWADQELPPRVTMPASLGSACTEISAAVAV